MLSLAFWVLIERGHGPIRHTRKDADRRGGAAMTRPTVLRSRRAKALSEMSFRIARRRLSSTVTCPTPSAAGETRRSVSRSRCGSRGPFVAACGGRTRWVRCSGSIEPRLAPRGPARFRNRAAVVAIYVWARMFLRGTRAGPGATNDGES